LLISIVFAAAFSVAGCGDSKSNEAPVELEDTLGFSREGQMELQSRVENETARCMKNQGFDYVPVDPFAQQQALTGKARLTDEDFIKEFGYGISTLFGRGNAQADPNERIRNSLGTADKAAYDRALGGDNRERPFPKRSTPVTSRSSVVARRRPPTRRSAVRISSRRWSASWTSSTSASCRTSAWSTPPRSGLSA